MCINGREYPFTQGAEPEAPAIASVPSFKAFAICPYPALIEVAQDAHGERHVIKRQTQQPDPDFIVLVNAGAAAEPVTDKPPHGALHA